MKRTMTRRSPATAKNTAAQRKVAKASVKGVPLRRQRMALAERDVAHGRKDTDRRGTPNDLPRRGR
jgi:hypothetical protein